MITPEQLNALTRAIAGLTTVVERIQSPSRECPQLLSAATVARMLDCSPDWIMRAWRAGEFPDPDEKLFGGERGWRWRVETVESFLLERSPALVEADDGSTAPQFKRVRM